MATSRCSPVTFFRTFENAFYFKVATGTDVDEDVFGKSNKESKIYWVRSKDNKFLLLNEDRQFQAQNLTETCLSQLDCKFKIQTYLDTTQGRVGTAVMLYATINNTNYVAYSNSNRDICSKKMALPPQLEGPTNEAVFYMKTLSQSNAYTFESSVYKGEFLAFEPDIDDPSLSKLVLHRKGEREVVDSCEVNLRDFKTSP